MLDGVNDEEQHAHLLGKLLETFEVIVNMISFNPIGILSQFDTSGDKNLLITTLRKQMGQDISGACGQLVIKKSAGAGGVTNIEDLHL
ncbi:dual-specificity RNA methyltransferase RlmN [Tanacetum coccineum]